MDEVTTPEAPSTQATYEDVIQVLRSQFAEAHMQTIIAGIRIQKLEALLQEHDQRAISLAGLESAE